MVHNLIANESAINTARPTDDIPLKQPHNTEQAATIWVGYTKRGQNYLDKQSKEPHTEEQVRCLIRYYQQHFSRTERHLLRWLYCQRPVVQIGHLKTTTFVTNEESTYPREVHFENLQRADTLTTGFGRPEVLRDDTSFFHESSSFNVTPDGMTECRQVLCIGHEVNKRYLIWPLAFSFSIAAVVAIVIGLLSRSVASGAEAGGFIGMAIVLLWSYILWLLG